VAEEKARALLARVGLSAHIAKYPAQLSGGQQQRVAIARSIVNQPALILADEPTGALDTASSEDVMRLFERLNEERGITLLLVTHEPDIAAHAKRIVTFRDGKIVADERTVPRREGQPV
jgi:putative ABC transport system ATP-binding protein